MPLYEILIVVGVAAVVAVLLRLTQRIKIPVGLRRLPGPKGLPIIGSVHKVPEKLGWIKFADWGKQYGPIYQVDLAGHNHVWISRDKIAHDLLSKRSHIYSDRPRIPALLSDNRDSGHYLPLMSRNAIWHRQRRFAAAVMRASERVDFNQYPELEAIRLCTELLDDPMRYNVHLESFIARVTSRLAWGHSEASEELKQRARELLIGVSPAGALGNKVPFLMSLPDWLSPARAWERKRGRTEYRFFQIMQSQVQADDRKKTANCCWAKMFLDSRDRFAFASDKEGAYAVGMHGIAGALTIAAPMQAFCLAMCHYPQYLPMLQEELDRVCGERLPTNADKPSLPFLRACIREVIRWRPPVPTGIPHFLTKDDEYDGYFIPKGSIIHPLEWAISRNPVAFPEPDSFNPLRWLNPNYPTYKEPLSQYPTILNMTQFGYGQRTCQGQTVTEADLIVGIGSIAWLFDMSKDCTVVHDASTSFSTEELATCPSPSSRADTNRAPASVHQQQFENSSTQDPTLQFTSLLIAKPLPFKFSLVPRSDSRVQLVRRLFAEKKAEGEFVEARKYWGEDCGMSKDSKFGWVPVGPKGEQILRCW